MVAAGFHALTSVIDYPMLVVTCANGHDRAGCLVGFATQCSIAPLRYVVCISQANHTALVASQADVLAVHLLAWDQKDLAELFGSRTGDDIDKFERCRWEPGPAGTPLLVDCPYRFVGRVVDRLGLGDHTGYLLDVAADADSTTGKPGAFRPLTYQQIRDLVAGHPA